jgi:hypothetical protein
MGRLVSASRLSSAFFACAPSRVSINSLLKTPAKHPSERTSSAALLLSSSLSRSNRSFSSFSRFFRALASALSRSAPSFFASASAFFLARSAAIFSASISSFVFFFGLGGIVAPFG